MEQKITLDEYYCIKECMVICPCEYFQADGYIM